MSTPGATQALTDAQYHEVISATLARIEKTVDTWLQDDVVDIDAARTGGMLTLSLPDRSQLIVNAQPPLQELWLASRAAGQHFRHVDGRWLDTRDGSEFFEALSRQTTAQGGRALAFLPA